MTVKAFDVFLSEQDIHIVMFPLRDRHDLGIIESIEALLGLSRIMHARVPKLN